MSLLILFDILKNNYVDIVEKEINIEETDAVFYIPGAWLLNLKRKLYSEQNGCHDADANSYIFVETGLIQWTTITNLPDAIHDTALQPR